MKISELLREQQLNEVAPLAFLLPHLPAGLAWIAGASAMTIVIWVMAGWSSYSAGEYIKDTVRKEGPDPRQWSDETKRDLAQNIIVEALFVAVPLALRSKIGKAAIAGAVSMWPNAVTQQAYEKMLPRIEDIIANPRDL